MTFTSDELYEMANDIFDEEVFAGTAGDKLLEEYNDIPDDDAREKLFDIVREMEESAREAIEKEMRRIARERKGEFIREVRQKWACPDCSDQFKGEYVMLTRTKDGWECPKCHCTTWSPKDDACYDMTDNALIG